MATSSNSRVSNSVQLWCGICDILCPTASKLDEHNNSMGHAKKLRKYNVFPQKEAQEFAIYYVSQPKSEVAQEDEGPCKLDTRFWCKVCHSPSNDIQSFQDHNRGVKHKSNLVRLDLPKHHGDYEFHDDYIMTPFYSSEYHASRPVHYEVPLVGLEIIASFKALGISIPPSVRKVLRVKKLFVLTEEERLTCDKDKVVEDLGEIHHSVVLVDNNTIVGMFVFDEIPLIECVEIERISRGIYAAGGEVKRSDAKGSDKIVMCGWRRDMGKRMDDIDAFGRYSHGVRKNSKKENIRGPELEDMGDHLTGDLLAPHLKRLFPTFMEELNLLLTEVASSMFFGTIGGQSLTTLAITSNYFALPHLDLQDLGFAFLTWFVKDRHGTGHIKCGGEFILPEHGLFVTPKNGLIFAFSTSTILHCTRVATGYDVIGMSCSAKRNVINKASTRTQQIKQYLDDQERLRQQQLEDEAMRMRRSLSSTSGAIKTYVRRSRGNDD